MRASVRSRQVDLEPASAPDAVPLCRLREAAARWQLQRGIQRWQPGDIPVATFRSQIKAGVNGSFCASRAL